MLCLDLCGCCFLSLTFVFAQPSPIRAYCTNDPPAACPSSTGLLESSDLDHASQLDSFAAPEFLLPQMLPRQSLLSEAPEPTEEKAEPDAGTISEVATDLAVWQKMGDVVAAHIDTKICDVMYANDTNQFILPEACVGRAVAYSVINVSQQVTQGEVHVVTVALAMQETNGTQRENVPVAKVEASVYKKSVASCSQFAKPYATYEGGTAGCREAQRERSSGDYRVVILSVQRIDAGPTASDGFSVDAAFAMLLAGAVLLVAALALAVVGLIHYRRGRHLLPDGDDEDTLSLQRNPSVQSTDVEVEL